MSIFPPNTNVVSYLRFSTPEQQRGDSQRRQIALAEAWCKQHDLKMSEPLKDLGVSAFRGKNIKEGALSFFLELVKNKKIPTNTVLLLEELDRLSRANPNKSLELLLSLINSGITVVTLAGSPQVFSPTASINETTSGLLMAIIKLSAGHFESVKKSERIAESWAQKRKNIGTVKISNKYPAWLKLQDNKFEIIPDKAAVVREIFALTIKGFGAGLIAKKLRSEGKKIANKDIGPSYIKKILNDRKAVGDYQPHKTVVDPETHTVRKTPVGDPIKNYFPSIVSEETYLLARQEAKKRGKGRVKGRVGKIPNMIGGLIFNREGHGMTLHGKKRGFKYYPRMGFDSQPGCEVKAIDYLLLLTTGQLIAPASGKVETESVEVERARLEETITKLEAVKKKFYAGANLDSLIDMMTVLESQKKEQQAKIEQLEAETIEKPVSSAFEHAVAELFDYANTGVIDYEKRLYFKQQFRRIVKKVVLHTEKIGFVRRSFVEIYTDFGDREFEVYTHSKFDDTFALWNPDGESWDILAYGPNYDAEKETFFAALEAALLVEEVADTHQTTKDYLLKLNRPAGRGEAARYAMKLKEWCKGHGEEWHEIKTNAGLAVVYPVKALKAVVGR